MASNVMKEDLEGETAVEFFNRVAQRFGGLNGQIGQVVRVQRTPSYDTTSMGARLRDGLIRRGIKVTVKCDDTKEPEQFLLKRVEFTCTIDRTVPRQPWRLELAAQT